ncbi:MAG: A24 family peptidase [Acidaminococcaceae bacterium]
MMYLICYVIGMVVGSLLYIIIDCLTKQQILILRISCARCHSRLLLYDLIPVIGHIISSGRCRRCGQLFSIRKPLIELLTGFLFVLCFTILGASMQLLKALIFTCFLIVISFIDYDHSLIYDKVLLPMAAVGVISNIVIGAIKLPNMLIAALLGGSIFLVLAIVSKGGFGGGDIKFMACVGLWLGFKYTILVVLLSFIFGGLGAAILLLFKKKTIIDKFPYGPYIAMASFITLLYGDFIVTWYWNWAFHVK